MLAYLFLSKVATLTQAILSAIFPYVHFSLTTAQENICIAVFADIAVFAVFAGVAVCWHSSIRWHSNIRSPATFKVHDEMKFRGKHDGGVEIPKRQFEVLRFTTSPAEYGCVAAL